MHLLTHVQSLGDSKSVLGSLRRLACVSELAVQIESFDVLLLT